ncbi:MAG: PadR family transcriptional regulator [Bacteroidota bacterium]
MFNKDLIRGTLKPIILSVLKDRGCLYGYEINKLVSELTTNQIQLTDGALYPMLHRLEKDGLVTTEIKNVGNRTRKYYKLTQTGNTESSKKVDELMEFIKTISLIVKPQKI